MVTWFERNSLPTSPIVRLAADPSIPCAGLGFSVGGAVSAAVQVGGESIIAGNTAHRALLYSGGWMLDLNSLIGPGSGFTLESATGISDTGFITGHGIAPAGQRHAFFLVPEPSGLVLLGTGAVGMLGYGAWRRSRAHV